MTSDARNACSPITAVVLADRRVILSVDHDTVVGIEKTPSTPASAQIAVAIRDITHRTQVKNCALLIDERI
jgi:hypothetical protein